LSTERIIMTIPEIVQLGAQPDESRQPDGRRSAGAAKRVYQAPRLQVFGRISTLTQSASGCERADNAGCSSPPGNMGPIPRLNR
jgi:hypothetical protein